MIRKSAQSRNGSGRRRLSRGPQSPAAPALEFYPEPGWREILFTLFSANCRPLLQAAALFALGVVTALFRVRLAHRISPLPSGLKPVRTQVQKDSPLSKPGTGPAVRPVKKRRAISTPLAPGLGAGLTSGAASEGKNIPGKLSLAASPERVSPGRTRSRSAKEAGIVAPDTVVRYGPRPTPPEKIVVVFQPEHLHKCSHRNLLYVHL